MKMILKDKTEIEVQDGVSLTDNVVVVNDFAAIDAIAKSLTKEGNLDSVQYVNKEGIATGIYSNMKIVTPLVRADYRNDGKVLVSFSIREKTEDELEIENLKRGQSVQDGAIMELAGMMGGE